MKNTKNVMNEVDSGETNYEFLEEEFLSELDSWFTADIKCCNNCYDDFVANWPISLDNVYEDSCIDVLYFYNNSRLNLLYTKDQFINNLYRVRCSRCGQGLEKEFWAFEFDFENFEELESDFQLLKQDIKETPFLVLKNSLANDTFNLLENLFNSTSKSFTEIILYRGRKLKPSEVNKKGFLPPPQIFTNEGRYNHLGVPVVYAANNDITCYNELRKPEKNLYIAEFVISQSIKMLDLTKIDENETNDLLKAIVLSSLVSSKVDDNSKYKPEYYFTRFISDCCKFLGFDGIIYPSVQVGLGQNYVFFDTKIMVEEKIKNIYKYNL